jgi:solute carrier family 25 carnitine/acylcarnitine transporter 20/29
MEYLYGNLFGISQIVVGYPFDTIKTNMQNGKPISHYVKQPLKLYEGVKYPLIMNCISTGLLFGNYDFFYSRTENRLMSGVLTGIISSILLTPFDYRKVQAQFYGENEYIKHCIKLKNETYIVKLKRYYTGFGYTLSREVISIPIYFASFHYMSKLCNCDEYHGKWYANSFIAGGISGVNSWLCSYPLDTLKSRKQL